MTLQQDRETQFTARDLRLWIEAQGGVHHKSHGSHNSYRIEREGEHFGKIIPCIADPFPVSKNMTAKVAEQFGQSRAWLLKELGVSERRAGRIRKGVARTKVPQVGRNDVVRSLDECIAAATTVRATLKGQRDPEHYRRLLEQVAPALRHLSTAKEVAS